ncbi:MAG: DUF5004 domain-containing protein [Sphingobacteriaceae bacterium]|nr:MAG: DUF5004 domain-containing protein [Sphingobacteriaceae bacterium]
MKTFNKYISCLAIVLAIAATSCKVERIKPVKEGVKSIAGSWKVVKAIRNGADITNFNGLDLSKFRINFAADKSYTLVDKLPFIVYGNGSYSLDDIYPMGIVFTPTGPGATPAQSTLIYPIVNGVRRIQIDFTANPGCTNNSYTYFLEEAK